LPDGVPAIVMGDLNDHAGSPMYQTLTARASPTPGSRCGRRDGEYVL